MTRHMLPVYPMLLGALALAVPACDGPEELDGEVTALVVRGVVEDESGTPVAGAVVHVGWTPASCNELLEFPPDTTASDGAFAIQAWSWGTFSRACVNVRAEPPAGVPLGEVTLQRDSVPLHPRSGPDTLTVTVTLPPQ